MPGEEVDRLVASVVAGGLDDHWTAVMSWLTSLTRARAGALLHAAPVEDEVKEIVEDTVVKLVRAMSARAFLMATSSARKPAVEGVRRPAEPIVAWHNCFTHVFVFRAWTAQIVTRRIIDGARVRARAAGAAADLAYLERQQQDTTTEDAPDGEMDALHRAPALIAIIAEQHAAGQRRADHMRHTLARLPLGYWHVVARAYPSLELDGLPVARTDAEMAEQLGTTVSNVESTRSNYRSFITRRHPELSKTLEVILAMTRHREGPSR